MMKLPLQREERTLKNGMKVILIRKEGFARSLFMIGIPAGSTNLMDEGEQGMIHHPQGCAHFLEHQMFRLNGEDVTYPLARAGAKTNACTSYDETCYYVWTNGDPYEPLRLLIEFVQTLEISPETVNKEKGIILSEYSQYDQDPESRLLKETFRSLYFNHPMREDILGTPQDISAMSDADLELFYKTWYDPGQLVLVGVTGQPLDALFAFIEQQEAAFPSAFQRPARKIMPEEPAGVLRESFTLKMDVDLAYACLGAKLAPCKKGPKEAVREDYMLNIWLNGIFSTLNPQFQSWLDTHLIGGMSGAEADIAEDHGYLLIYAQSNEPKRYLKTMKETLLKKEPLSKDVFESLLIREKASSIRLADQFESLASQSVEGYFKGFDPLEDLQLLETITLEELNAYIAGLDFSSLSETTIFPANLQMQEAEDIANAEAEKSLEEAEDR